MDVEWRKLLLTLSDHLEEKNVRYLSLLQGIPDGDAESMSGVAFRVLQYLERGKKICPENPHLLLEMLDDIHRNDLKKYVLEFIAKFHGGNSRGTGLKDSPSRYTIERSKGSPCGICVIISNETFASKKHKKRKGTLADEKSLKDTFEWLGFEVQLEQNCTADQIYQKLKAIADKNHGNYTAFVCCILTHGGESELIGTDSKPMERAKIARLFGENSCEGLAGKPKIFLFQACRGSDLDYGFLKSPTESSEQTYHPHDEQDVGQSFDDSPTAADEKARDVSATVRKETERNFYLIFPSVRGNKALRDESEGTWLVSSFCRVLQQEADKSELHSMMRKVKDEIASKESSTALPYKTTAEIEDNLDFDDVFFSPPMPYEDYLIRRGEIA